MQSERTEKIINKIEEIPTLPFVVVQINSVLKNNTETIERVSSIIEKDTALTSKILRLANSSYYGFARKVDSLARAITILGFNTVRNLAVTVSLFNIYSKSNLSAFDINGLWFHALGSAIASKALIKNKALQEKAFMCGLMHDIGKLILYLNVPEKMDLVIEKIHENKTLTLVEAEMEVLQFTHAEAGAIIAEKWHFPSEFSEVIKYHHFPERIKDYQEMAYSVHAGNEIAKALCLGTSTSEKINEINPITWDILDQSETKLSALLLEIERDFSDIASFW